MTEAVTPVAHACAVHLGIAAARDLFPGIADAQRRAKFAAELTRQVTDKLRQLHTHPRLPLHAGHFLVGVTQLSSAGEGIMADACDAAAIALRVFLPQPRDALLAARSSRPPYADDFSPAQREHLLCRLQRAGVWQEKVASVAPERAARFAQTSAEVLALADIAVILQPKHRDGLAKPGGVNAFAGQALRSAKPVYALTFWIDEKQQLHLYDELRYPRDKTWIAPCLPAVLPAPELALDDMAQRVAAECAARAQHCREQATRASAAVVRNCLGLAALGLLALLLVCLYRNTIPPSMSWLLLAPCLLLLPGGLLLWRASGGAAATPARLRQRWTDLQLAAEIAHSTRLFAPGASTDDTADSAFAGQAHDFAFLFALALPADQRVLAQTLTVAHLRRMRGIGQADWQVLCDRYRHERLDQPVSGQRAVFAEKLAQVQQHIRAIGLQSAGLAVFAVAVLLVALAVPATAVHPVGVIALVVSLLAVQLPLAALLLQARRCRQKHRMRAQACAALLQDLQHLSQQLQQAASEEAFLALQAQSETRLLSAALDWYRWRRSGD
ncbi:hypothetical protein DFR29_102171 [Tahibacter aquaticus]|uniref:Uncharacterized protein n=1 Tax=Tahibacter aquaticus TaxID=520092 RepID=A0A4R6Z6V7_9GAMM|nr:hypothetical protein [Tahibacter aquaticus]TDR47511.1 hypothetical protein DFR29_102171 [Tahibacter aquaticus]